MSEAAPLLLIERQGPVAIVTLNRPDKRNALSEKLWGELKTTFEGFGPDVRCVVLAGAGSISALASISRNIVIARRSTAFSCRGSPTRRWMRSSPAAAGGDGEGRARVDGGLERRPPRT